MGIGDRKGRIKLSDLPLYESKSDVGDRTHYAQKHPPGWKSAACVKGASGVRHYTCFALTCACACHAPDFVTAHAAKKGIKK
jgi:hypothetical protein